MQDLSLQVGAIDDVAIDDRKRPDTGRRQVIRRGRTESTRSDQEHFGVEQFLLTLDADLRDEEMTAVALELFGRES